MTNYYVRVSGSDAAAGTSAGAAWRTLGKALGASGIASGDTVYVGAGVHREAVVIAMTSAVAETTIHGDVTGEFTGDAGEVVLTNYLLGWNDSPSASDVMNLAGRDFLTFRNLTFIGGSSGNCIDGTTATPVNITVDSCFLTGFGIIPLNVTSAFATAMNWTIKNSYIMSMMGQGAIQITLTTGAGADYDSNIQIQDCVAISAGSAAINIQNSGTAANKGGGVDISRCTLYGSTGITTSAALQLSTTIPCTYADCLLFPSVSAGTNGQLIDSGNNIHTNSATNVTLHATSKTTTEDFPCPALSMGHEWIWGLVPRPAWSPMFPGQLARGHISSGSSDIGGRTRPEGTSRWHDSGTATAGAATTITDSGKAWAVNVHIGRLIVITGGTGAGAVKRIISNTATVLTVGGTWTTTPSTDSTYIIYDGPVVETNKATSGTATTFTVSSAAWSTNKWAGYSLEITAGAQSGNTRSISSSSGTTLTVAAFPGALDNTSVGSIYWPGTSLSHTGDTSGAFDLHDTASKETTTTDAGSVGITISGPGSHEFLVPVDASATVITIKMRYDTNHGTTNKPQAILLANGEIGVATETETMTSGADTWDTLTFSSFTPTAKGVVVIRLVSRSGTPYGKCFADTWTVT